MRHQPVRSILCRKRAALALAIVKLLAHACAYAWRARTLADAHTNRFRAETLLKKGRDATPEEGAMFLQSMTTAEEDDGV